MNAQVLLDIEATLVHLHADNSQETVPPLPTIQGIAVRAGIDTYPAVSPGVEVQVIPVGRGPAFTAAQALLVLLEWLAALGTFFFGPYGPGHAKLAITIYSTVQVGKHLWGFPTMLARFSTVKFVPPYY